MSFIYSKKKCIMCQIPVMNTDGFVSSFCEHCTEYLMESSRDVDLMARVDYLEMRCKHQEKEIEILQKKYGDK